MLALKHLAPDSPLTDVHGLWQRRSGHPWILLHLHLSLPPSSAAHPPHLFCQRFHLWLVAVSYIFEFLCYSKMHHNEAPSRYVVIALLATAAQG